ncbi:MAG: hypothetical protein RLZZ496_804, partial [Pseudomonadota bacterium]
MTRPLLQIQGVETFYGRNQALHGVNLDVREGEIVTMIGANGAGKSTLMMAICGVNKAARGSIHFDGKPIHLI